MLDPAHSSLPGAYRKARAHQFDAGDVAAFVGREKRHDLGNFVQGSGATEGYIAQDAVCVLLDLFVRRPQRPATRAGAARSQVSVSDARSKLLENDSFVSVEQDAVFDMPADGSGEHYLFQVSALFD